MTAQWHPGWDSLLKDNPVRIDCEAAVSARVVKARKVFPPIEARYRALNYFAPEEAKVVIVGQDPYHGAGQANGLSFSVERGQKIPPSLRNIFREVQASGAGDTQLNGDLSHWAKQGVLLLNSVLSVEEGNANSHESLGWQTLTSAIISEVSNRSDHCVFMLWGAYAQKLSGVVAQDKHCILKAAHPSPLSAYRGFFGCDHFNLANSYLEKAGREPINWTIPDIQPDLF